MLERRLGTLVSVFRKSSQEKALLWELETWAYIPSRQAVRSPGELLCSKLGDLICKPLITTILHHHHLTIP